MSGSRKNTLYKWIKRVLVAILIIGLLTVGFVAGHVVFEVNAQSEYGLALSDARIVGALVSEMLSFAVSLILWAGLFLLAGLAIKILGGLLRMLCMELSPDAAIGERLRALREERGFTLREIERRTAGRLSSSHLSQIENGRVAEPSLAVLRDLAHAYGLHLGSLLGVLHIVDTPGVSKREQLMLSFIRGLDEPEQAEAIRFVKYLSERTDSVES